MAKNFDERLANIKAELENVSKKAADVYGDTQAAFELGQEVLEAKLKDARGDAVAAQERLREAGEESRSHLSSQVIKAQMKLEAKIEGFRNTRDKKKLEKYIDNHVLYMADLYDTITYLLIDAELTAMETLSAVEEYRQRFGEPYDETDVPAAEETDEKAEV